MNPQVIKNRIGKALAYTLTAILFIGISCFLEHSGGNPTEGASLSFADGETLVLGMGVQNTGQGHATVFPRLVAERLGIKAEHVRHRHGDTNLGINGFASVGSRSAMTAGSAIVKTIDVMLEKGRKAAANQLVGRFDDEFVRTPQGWRFAGRRGRLLMHT